MILRSRLRLKQLAKNLHQTGKKIVWTNGCFDLFHYGHLINLQKAKRLGDVLIVGLNGDRSPYFQHKPGRPLQNELARSRVLEALECVDHVFIFQEETPLKTIEALLPDVLTKGADYSKKTIVGAQVVRKNGGKVRTIPLLPGYSTTTLIQTILNAYDSTRPGAAH